MTNLAPPPGDIAPEGGLARLLETEARLSRRLIEAEAEAERTRAAARAAAAAEAARLQSQIDAEVVALVRRVASERDAELERITAETTARCQSWQQLAPAVVDRMAREVIGRVLSLEREEPAS